MTLQTRLSEIEEAHVDAAFLALSKLRDSLIDRADDRATLIYVDSAIYHLRCACREMQNEKGTGL